MTHYIGPLSFYLFGVILLLVLVAIIKFSSRPSNTIMCNIIDLVKYGIVCLFMIAMSLILTNLGDEKQLEKKMQMTLKTEMGHDTSLVGIITP